MVGLERHHRRLRAKSTAIHVGMIPLALAVPLAWLYFSFGACQEAESPGMLAACRLFSLAPLAPVFLAAAAAVWIVWDLARIGAHHRRAPKPSWGHALHGYRSLDRRHKRHVHWAALQAAAVSAALVAWLAIKAYRTTH